MESAVSVINKVKKAFDLVCLEYLEMFKTHYPKATGGGLNEANQTYYFCKNLSQVINDTLSTGDIKSAVSLETPYGKNMRMDGVVVSPATKEIFFIQAKRLKSSQMDSVVKDVIKVYEAKDKLLNKIEQTDSSIIYKKYLVILADVWVHNSNAITSENRLSIPKWWAGEDSEGIKINFNNPEYKYPLLTPKNFFVEDVPKEINWKNKNQLIHRFSSIPSKKILDEYCLFCGFNEI
jgi:hypothetical protein